MALAVVTHWRLENHRHGVERRFVQEPLEDLDGYLSLAKICVSITLGAEFVFGVVQVEAARFFCAKQVEHRTDELTEAGRLVKRVSGGKCVTGIDADADPVRLVSELTDSREVLQAIANEGALTGGVLE